MSYNYTVNIINLRYSKPGNEYDFKIDRGTPVGNPYYMSDESKRDKVCDKYETWFEEHKNDPAIQAYLSRMAEVLFCFGSINLFCWCAPKRCHGETIKEYLLERMLPD